MCDGFVCFLGLTFEQEWGIERRAPAFTSYDVRPEVEVPIVRNDDAGARETLMARWGLVPVPGPDGRRPRSRTLVSARSLLKDGYTGLWRRGQRCIFPMQGFFVSEKGKGKAQVPVRWFVSLSRQKMLGVAGVWDFVTDTRTRIEIMSAAIVTISSQPDIAEFNSIRRALPVVLAKEAYATWLGHDDAAAARLLRPFPPGEMRAERVGDNADAHGPPGWQPTVRNPAA